MPLFAKNIVFKSYYEYYDPYENFRMDLLTVSYTHLDVYKRQVLLDRVTRRDTRPLLKNGDPREIVTRLLADREPIYAQADLAVDSADGPHVVAVERIVEALKDLGFIA